MMTEGCAVRIATDTRPLTLDPRVPGHSMVRTEATVRVEAEAARSESPATTSWREEQPVCRQFRSGPRGA